jgi:hypothetical protein
MRLFGLTNAINLTVRVMLRLYFDFPLNFLKSLSNLIMINKAIHRHFFY